MADEITIGASIRAIKGNLRFERAIQNQKVTMAGDAYSATVQSIATTAAGTAVTVTGAFGTPGYTFLRNLDGTNYVEIGRQVSSTFYPVCRLNAGEFALLRLATSTSELYARANTSAVLLEIGIVEA